MTEFVTDGVNGLVTPTLDPAALAQTVLRALNDPALSARLRQGARDFAEAHLGMEDYIARYRAYIEEVAGRPLCQPAMPAEASRPKKLQKAKAV